MMADTALIASAIIGGIGTADSMVRGRAAQKLQEKNAERQKREAAQRTILAEQEFNKKNQKKPDISSVRASNSMATNPSSMLTSPTGATGGTIGKSTLLGGG